MTSFNRIGVKVYFSLP